MVFKQFVVSGHYIIRAKNTFKLQALINTNTLFYSSHISLFLLPISSNMYTFKQGKLAVT